MQKTYTVRPFGMRDKVGYLFGDFGNDFTFLLSSSFLLKFYTDVIGIDAFIVGAIMMLARFVDAFTDVTMGRICDRSKMTAAGKFKPWLLRMCGPVAVASFLIYQSSLANAAMWVKIMWLFVTYILWGSVFYTAINIPYGSMASAISADPGDRQSLSTFRSMGSVLASAFVSIGVPLIAYDTLMVNGEEQVVMNGSRFTMIAGVFSVLAIICYLLCYKLVTERVRPEASLDAAEQTSVGTMLKNAMKNRALISIIAASIVMLLSQLTMQSMAGYIYPNYYRSATAQSASTAIMCIGMVASAVLAKPLSKKFGKAEISIAANLFATIVCVILFILRPQNVWVYIAFQTLCWFGLGIFSMVTWALITDVIDYCELKNGVREDGSVYALYSFARKIGQAASAGVTGALLSLIGYTEATAFAPDVVEGIFNIATLVPALGFLLLSLVLWFWYPLHQKQVAANVAALKEKHGE